MHRNRDFVYTERIATLLSCCPVQEELDPVTLHNLALMQMDADPTGGFRKFNFLLQSPPFPPETFGERL